MVDRLNIVTKVPPSLVKMSMKEKALAIVQFQNETPDKYRLGRRKGHTFADGSRMNEWWMNACRDNGIIEKDHEIREIIKKSSLLWQHYSDNKKKRDALGYDEMRNYLETHDTVTETQRIEAVLKFFEVFHRLPGYRQSFRLKDNTNFGKWWKDSVKKGRLSIDAIKMLKSNDDVFKNYKEDRTFSTAGKYECIVCKKVLIDALDAQEHTNETGHGVQVKLNNNNNNNNNNKNYLTPLNPTKRALNDFDELFSNNESQETVDVIPSSQQQEQETPLPATITGDVIKPLTPPPPTSSSSSVVDEVNNLLPLIGKSHLSQQTRPVEINNKDFYDLLQRYTNLVGGRPLAEADKMAIFAQYLFRRENWKETSAHWPETPDESIFVWFINACDIPNGLISQDDSLRHYVLSNDDVAKNLYGKVLDVLDKDNNFRYRLEFIDKMIDMGMVQSLDQIQTMTYPDGVSIYHFWEGVKKTEILKHSSTLGQVLKNQLLLDDHKRYFETNNNNDDDHMVVSSDNETESDLDLKDYDNVYVKIDRLGNMLNDKDCKSAARIIKSVEKVIKKNRRLRSRRKISMGRMHEYKIAMEKMYSKSKKWTDDFLGEENDNETGDFDKDLKTLSGRVDTLFKNLKEKEEKLKAEISKERKEREEYEEIGKQCGRKMIAIGRILTHGEISAESKVEKVGEILQAENISILDIVNLFN